MKSIRVFLIAALLSAVSLGIFLAVVQGYRAGTANAQALLDTQLADFAAILADPGRSRANDVVPQPSERLAFQIWTVEGELLQRSANTPDNAITMLAEGYREENFAGHRWRVLSRMDSRTGLWVLVGERIDVRIGLADSVVLNSVLPIVVSLPVIAGIVWLVVGRGLSLVSGLADELGTKRADDLSRLRSVKPPRELVPVVDAINELLRRLEESIQRERRFSSDAAHELRTPISALKVHVHNLKKALPDQLPALQSLDDDLGRLGHIVEQMLTLYRTSPEHYQAKMQALDLYALAQSVISELYEDIDRRGQSISLEGLHLEINGDEASLRLLLSNLIQNASKYSPTGAEITVALKEEEFGVALQVSDTGPGIPLSELGRVLDRFYRVGGDRHASASEGCGLGLSIARHIADLHHANLALSNNDPGPGLTASVIFPYHASDTPDGNGQ